MVARRGAAALAVLAVLVASGCSAASTGPVTARLQEFSINLGRATASPGSVQFSVTNSGSVAHEFVVVDTDAASSSFSVGADGTVDEDGLSVVDEIEDIAVGANQNLAVNLSAGHYVLICNLPGHYAAGMRADFQVQ
jgi:uncharacterized cupredoxin-like copper-binding protein